MRGFSRYERKLYERKQHPRVARRGLRTEQLEARRLLTASTQDLFTSAETGFIRAAAPIDFSQFASQPVGDRVSYRGLSIAAVAPDPISAAFAIVAAIRPDVELQPIDLKYGLTGSYVSLHQVVDNVPVFGSAVSVHQEFDGTIRTVHLDVIQSFVPVGKIGPVLSAELADSISLNANGITETFGTHKQQKIWYAENRDQPVLAYETMISSVSPAGDFVTVVDAWTGEVLSKKNIAAYAVGSGNSFVPNPYQTQGSGVGLIDNNDANSVALNSQLISVPLPRLDEGTGLIRGQWADLSSFNSPTLPDVDANEPTRVYQYTRDDDRFEQVVIYQTIDAIQDYIHALGFDDDAGVPNGIRDFPTRANAHWDNEDQSFYSSLNDSLHFGDGGVDDGEDGDIVAHEYGHAIQHDQNPFWGGGETRAMGEGFGDYLAASFFADQGNATFQSNHAACVGEWDATSYSGTNPPCLRRVDGAKIYPDDLTGAVHSDGEIWSAALWEMRSAIGASTTDRLVLEHHFGLPGNATMQDAARAILDVDQSLSGGVNQTAITSIFAARGLLNVTSTGAVEFDFDTYLIGDTVSVTLRDLDLAGAGPISLTMTSGAGDSESVTLTELAAGRFVGTIGSANTIVTPSDGVLNVSAGDAITVVYNDADTGNGSTASISDTATFELLSTVFFADFSDATGAPSNDGFAVSGPASQWHASTGRGNDPGHSSDDSFYFGAGEGANGGGVYANGRDGTLTSPIIDLSTATTAQLRFNHFLASEADFDFASVLVIAGSNSTEIAFSSGGGLPVATTGFESVQLDLSAFAGQLIQIAFQFTTDESVVREGWYVDDVTVMADIATTPAILTGTKWADSNGDGVRDVGEQGLPDWTIFLDLDENGQLDQGEPQTLTDADGNYTFDGLAAGEYVVAEIQQIGWRQTFPTNDTINTPTLTGIDAGRRTFFESATIGDNPAIDPGLDVDIYEVSLNAGEQILIDIDADTIGSPLDSFLTLFNASGAIVASSDDDNAPGEPNSLDSYLEFTALISGLYYIGISDFSNQNYNPNVQGSGDIGDTGDYELNVEVVPATTTTSAFQIDIVFPDESITLSQRAVFASAAARWSEIIIGDLPNVGGIDDLEITATAPAIDGPGNILGRAGPTSLRGGSLLPFRGMMEFDSADVAALELNGRLGDVILHEMGHVLGFGTIWDILGLLNDTNLANPRYTGAGATAEYNAAFGVSEGSVPVENDGGDGTALGHWEESNLRNGLSVAFNNELMTGFLNSNSVNPISRVTIAQFADLGYQVNLNAADAFNPIGSPKQDLGQPIEGRLLALSPEQARKLLELNPSTASKSANGLIGLEGIKSPGDGIWRATVSLGQSVVGLDFGNQVFDITPPTITDVIVAGVLDPVFNWKVPFIDAVDDSGPSGLNNGLGFSVIGVTRTMPWYTVDTIYIRYSEPVTAPTGLSLVGSAIADYAAKFTVSHNGNLTTITMTSAFGLPENDSGRPTTGIDRLLLSIAAAGVSDLAGNPLVSRFSQSINVLPGDGNGSGTVTSIDVGQTNFRGSTIFGQPANNRGFLYDPFFDINSDAKITSADVGLTSFQGSDTLPSAAAKSPLSQSIVSIVPNPVIADSKKKTAWNERVDGVFADDFDPLAIVKSLE